MSTILQALDSNLLEVRLHYISDLRNANPNSLEAIFQKVSEDSHHQLREKAVQQITVFPKMYHLFVQDPDPQVKILLIQNSVKIREILHENSILDHFPAFISNGYIPIRIAVANTLSQHAKLSSDNNDFDLIHNQIIPLMDQLVKDTNDDVRISISEQTKAFAINYGFDFIFEKLSNVFKLILSDVQWRVRKNAFEILVGLSLSSSGDFADSFLFPFCFKYLKDPCHSLRLFAIDGIITLAAHFGFQWIQKKLMPFLIELSVSHNYLEREIYIQILSKFLSIIPPDKNQEMVFQPIIEMLKDPIESVNLLSIHLLKQNVHFIHPYRLENELKPIMQTMLHSSSQTIQIYANEFLVSVQDNHE